jgi:ubiquinone/menaquinone biosynthesis C-methylase UbiE
MSTNSFDSDSYKSGQRKQWDGVAAGWETWWETLEQMSQGVTDCLINLAEIQPGHKVLDIATGIGEPSITVAKRIGNKGKVVATDQSPNMLSIARKRADLLGLENIEFHELDAEDMDFPKSSFDAIVCRWGLMFVPNLDITLDSVYEMLPQSRKFATAVWDAQDKIPFFSFAREILQEMFDLPHPPSGTPTVDGLSGGVIEEKMAEAAFKNIRTKEITVSFEFSTAKEYTELMKGIAAPLKMMLTKQSPEQQAEYWQTLEEATAREYSIDSGSVILQSISRCVVGER